MSELGEKLRDRLNGLLGKALPSGLVLEGWRFDLHQVKLLEVGLKNNKLGGPYTAPSVKTDTEGEIYLIWRDQMYTSGKIDRLVLEEFQSNLGLWEKTAYKDPYGAGLVKPYRPPEVPLAQEEVKNILGGDFSYPFSLLNQGLKRLTEEFETEKVDGRVKISLDRRLVANSEGLWVQYEQTPVEIFMEGDDLFGDSFGEKRTPTAGEFNHLVNFTGNTLRELKKETSFPGEGERFILLPPKVFQAFLEHYLLSNLSGRLVASRQSAFGVEEFKEEKRIFREDFTVGVDGRRPYRYSSYRCTGEGVSTGATDYIVNGRLLTPVLTLKYAKKLEMEPTPIPVGGAQGLILDVPLAGNSDEVLSALGECLIVHSILGLHTQDYSSGRFSLTADQCLLVREGKTQGKVRTVIAGDFLGALSAAETFFVKFPGEETPACCFKAYVSQ